LTVLQPRDTPWYLRNSGDYGCVEKKQSSRILTGAVQWLRRSDEVWVS